ncbi:hypothetical protein FA95DRAFT_955259 [Auriscalpium vulgare]|uniref:Uncharacterized protein n=1 Tax=Auriscalpium vulgare TaxID=40419 RepID=A0ACB8R8U6_9AGAM|nr:hypothetical protein FA95DRAFT_955259 [Auriscalpium vulgare]
MRKAQPQQKDLTCSVVSGLARKAMTPRPGAARTRICRSPRLKGSDRCAKCASRSRWTFFPPQVRAGLPSYRVSSTSAPEPTSLENTRRPQRGGRLPGHHGASQQNGSLPPRRRHKPPYTSDRTVDNKTPRRAIRNARRSPRRRPKGAAVERSRSTRVTHTQLLVKIKGSARM